MQPPPAPSRILIIRPSALGDVCRTVPVLASLRGAFPGAGIDWLVQETFIDAVRAHPALTRAIPFARGRLGRELRRGRLGGVLGLARDLRGAGYDLVIDAQGLLRSALMALATGARRRIGHADARELGFLVYTTRVPPGAREHAVERMLDLARAAGAEPVRDMRLHAPEAARAWARSRRDLDEGYVVLAPGARWPAKRWPAERFTEVARALVDAGERVALAGSAQERAQCAPLLDLAAREARVVDLVGRTGVGEAMALIERARLVIACDSAAAHIAVGFDRPLVALFGPTRVERVGPYGRAGDVIRHVEPGERVNHKDPAQGALMERISVREVVAAALRRLEAPRA